MYITIIALCEFGKYIYTYNFRKNSRRTHSRFLFPSPLYTAAWLVRYRHIVSIKPFRLWSLGKNNVMKWFFVTWNSKYSHEVHTKSRFIKTWYNSSSSYLPICHISHLRPCVSNLSLIRASLLQIQMSPCTIYIINLLLSEYDFLVLKTDPYVADAVHINKKENVAFGNGLRDECDATRIKNWR